MQQDIIDAIAAERRHQDRKWGRVTDRPRDVGAWLLLTQLELAEAQEAWAKSTDDWAALLELVQVAALAVACLEQHGVPWASTRWGLRANNETAVYSARRVAWLELMAAALDRYLTTGEGRADLERLREEDPGR